MRQTLRRSCAACAKSKHSCDLRTPRCSRCMKRKVQCVYANEPLTAPPAAPGWEDGGSIRPLDGSGTLTSYRFGPLDPFDSYPQTRLPREHVQRLIHSCTYVFDRSRPSKLSLPIQFSTRSLSSTTLSTWTQPQIRFSSLGGHLLWATQHYFTSRCRQHVLMRSCWPRRAFKPRNFSWPTLWLYSDAKLKTRHWLYKTGL